MKQLPNNVTKYFQSETFTQDTVPDKLLHDHDTKKGTWGHICVTEGVLEYTTLDDQKTYTLTPEQSGVVEPEIKHKIQPKGEVRFYIEFYK
ncbi:MAG: DUF1971 domain-containing protein [Bdellovibrionales bacterium]|nr:DUF1971 domain-containing protein [Bdellovibrionales bacterium]